MKEIVLRKSNSEKIVSAKYDLRFLLNLGYKKKNALNFVANRYVLDKKERNLLSRTVFSKEVSESRSQKKIDLKQLKNQTIIIDGYNVLITVETICEGNYDKLVIGDDEFLRDVNAVFGKYKYKKTTKKALMKIFDVLCKYEAEYIYVLFDKQVSFSGKLAVLTKTLLESKKLKGEVILSGKVDFEIKELSNSFKGVVATGDGVIIDKVDRVIDLPFNLIKKDI
ncbi:MAG: DUF434 domain-containing protein [Methanobacteriaceae archaeon]|nr:DUF434 domain-containing protein [Methanobacteriaceae archaeon]